MIAHVTYQGRSMKLYEGKVVPEMVSYEHIWDCGNVYCSHIKCEDCILYPTGEANVVKEDYLNELRLGEW